MSLIRTTAYPNSSSGGVDTPCPARAPLAPPALQFSRTCRGSFACYCTQVSGRRRKSEINVIIPAAAFTSKFVTCPGRLRSARRAVARHGARASNLIEHLGSFRCKLQSMEPCVDKSMKLNPQQTMIVNIESYIEKQSHLVRGNITLLQPGMDYRGTYSFQGLDVDLLCHVTVLTRHFGTVKWHVVVHSQEGVDTCYDFITDIMPDMK
ncbi:hypothetical protein EVAR_68274_1 [Eumeta japonica]|uniref:Uncharacterized protein n=1 Tax=Eumeta variegata TaxID=151549 RepID=A0A4C1ZUG6_EUMVA|nr:hypothetical protein EVAR_68274_1 [Eumeta japonica]